MFRTTHATSAGGQACLGGGRDDVASMCAACVEEHKPLLIPKRSVAHEAGEGWLKRDSCRASSTSGCGGCARWRRQGRGRRGRAGGEEMTVIAVWSHGLVRYGRSVPVDSNDKIAAFLKFLSNVQVLGGSPRQSCGREAHIGRAHGGWCRVPSGAACTNLQERSQSGIYNVGRAAQRMVCANSDSYHVRIEEAAKKGCG